MGREEVGDWSWGGGVVFFFRFALEFGLWDDGGVGGVGNLLFCPLVSAFFLP